jgi:hypothetical protein
MAGPVYSISVSIPAIGGGGGGAAEFPNLAHAVKTVAEAAQAQWVAYASGAPLPGGQSVNPRSGTYARSIMLRQTGAFAAEVYSDLSYAEAVETGAKARDLKEMLRSSGKTRRTKDGRLYLVIPFRWSQQGSVGSGPGNQMPAAVQNWWRGKAPSHVVSMGTRVSATGATVPQANYRWGDRLGQGDLARLGIGGTAARRMQGMVNFRAVGKKGGASHSSFVTFRTMVEGASGKWIAPAKPGKYPARTTAQQIRPVAERAFAEAVRRDLARALGGK